MHNTYQYDCFDIHDDGLLAATPHAQIKPQLLAVSACRHCDERIDVAIQPKTKYSKLWIAALRSQ